MTWLKNGSRRSSLSRVTGVRCPMDGAFVAHSFIAVNGIDVYRCTREDSYNDAGRHFISTASGLVEVKPLPVDTKHGDWAYELVDTERRRQQEEQRRINDELDARQKLYRNNMAKVTQRQAEQSRAEELAGEVED